MAGLTVDGLTIRTQRELQALMEAAVSEAFPEVDLAEGPEQQMIGVLSEAVAVAWETLQALYSGGYPDGAIGLLLDQLSALTGTARPAATHSLVTGTANLDAGITLPLGSIAAVDGNPDAQFRTLVAVTNAGGAPADVSVGLEALETGPVTALSGLLTVIVTPVAGWNTITNAEDAAPGRDLANDPELRALRETDLASSGTSPVDAIRADLLEVSDVTSATVFQNVGDVDDADGRPPHSVEALVLGGLDQDIADRLLTSVAGGIRAYGSTVVIAVDSQGISHNMGFTRPTQRDLYLEVDIDVDADTWPADGENQMRAALIAFEESSLGVRDDVILAKLYVPICSVSGVEDITEIRIGLAPSPAQTTNFDIGAREVADFDTGRIVINVTAV